MTSILRRCWESLRLAQDARRRVSDGLTIHPRTS